MTLPEMVHEERDLWSSIQFTYIKCLLFKFGKFNPLPYENFVKNVAFATKKKSVVKSLRWFLLTLFFVEDAQHPIT